MVSQDQTQKTEYTIINCLLGKYFKEGFLPLKKKDLAGELKKI